MGSSRFQIAILMFISTIQWTAWSIDHFNKIQTWHTEHRLLAGANVWLVGTAVMVATFEGLSALRPLGESHHFCVNGSIHSSAWSDGGLACLLCLAWGGE